MPKSVKKVKKNSSSKEKPVKEEVKDTVESPEDMDEEKETSTLSDGVLDAFDELSPVDPLLEDEAILPEDDEDDEIDSGDYRPSDEW